MRRPQRSYLSDDLWLALVNRHLHWQSSHQRLHGMRCSHGVHVGPACAACVPSAPLQCKHRGDRAAGWALIAGRFVHERTLTLCSRTTSQLLGQPGTGGFAAAGRSEGLAAKRRHSSFMPHLDLSSDGCVT